MSNIIEFKDLQHAQHILNSRPIDVHRWSDHPEVKKLIDQLWSEFVSEYPNYIASSDKRGPKPKATNKKQFKVVLLDLYVCWSEDHEQWLSVSLSPKDYESVNSRYNALFISSIIIQMIKDMKTLGWIDLIPGTPNPNNIANGRGYQTRIRATDSLTKLFSSAKFTAKDCPISSDKEVIILTKKDDLQIQKSLGKAPRIQYEDTLETIEMRTNLKAYNALLNETQIDVGPNSPDYLPQPTKKDPDKRVRIKGSRKQVERVFSRGSFEKHGRFYGGFWQQLNEDNRKLIHINGNPTIEVDYKALHIKLLYALNEEYRLYEEDPYIITWPESISSIPPDRHRKVVKLLMLHSINAKDITSAYQSFRSQCDAGTPEKRLTNNQLKLIVDNFVEIHPLMEPYIGNDTGINLMNVDGKMTAEIMRLLTKQGIPVLSIHDSYIVEREHFVYLRSAMAMAAIRIAGRDLFAVQDGIYVNRLDGYDNYSEESF